MDASPQLTPAADRRRETPRIMLARAASAAALAEANVTGLDGGTAARHTTFAGTERLPGVTVFADDGAYDVALYVTAAPTDLHALAAAIQRAVRRGAQALELSVRDVQVTFTDLTLPDETPRS